MEQLKPANSPARRPRLRVVPPPGPAPAGDAAGRGPQRPLLASILVDRGALSPEDLAKALALQRHQDLPIGEILLAHGMVAPDDLQEALAEQYGTTTLDLAQSPADATLSPSLRAAEAVALSAVPWRRAGRSLIVATSRPDNEAAIRAAFADQGPVILALAGRRQLQDEITRIYGPELARIAEGRAPSAISCRNWNPRRAALWLIAGLAVLAAAAALAPLTTTIAAFALTGLVFLGNTGLKLAAFLSALSRGRDMRIDGARTRALDAATARREGPAQLWRQPVVTLLVPLYREKDIAGHLVERLAGLDYPRALLDIILVVEADDATTQEALAEARLPPWMRAVTVPDGRPRTKPRALNYALNFARGSIIGIYDAEDRPEPDQIWRVVRRFADLPPEVACLQGRLDFYNAGHNWISRCFAIEYATWFRVLLPGVERLGLFVPLGGTTLFLRREALEALGAWDAHNVTEDAELGLRLCRGGYRTELIDTTTYEEANSAIWPWIKQRSRWQKGYMMTWSTAMRAPLRLWRDLGPLRFLGFQAQVLGAVLGFLTAPLLWSFALKMAGLPHPLDPVLSEAHYVGIGLVLLASLTINVAAAIVACEAPHLRRLRFWIPLTGLYFPLASLAAVKALAETVLRPWHWVKTDHGCYGVAAPAASSEVSTAPASSFSLTSNAIDR